jgi:hypothetical protein
LALAGRTDPKFISADKANKRLNCGMITVCETTFFVRKLTFLSETDFFVIKEITFLSQKEIPFLRNLMERKLVRQLVGPNVTALRLLKQAFASVNWEITPHRGDGT